MRSSELYLSSGVPELRLADADAPAVTRVAGYGEIAFGDDQPLTSQLLPGFSCDLAIAFRR